MMTIFSRAWHAIKSAFITDEMADVRQFNQKFGLLCRRKDKPPVHLTTRKLLERLEFLQEELDEFKLAIKTQDLAGQADALIDLVYVAKGTAVMMGLPWEELWSDVHRANMGKVRGNTKRGHLVDCMKPPGWLGPQTMAILEVNDYCVYDFHNSFDNSFSEEACHDDAVHKLP